MAYLIGSLCGTQLSDVGYGTKNDRILPAKQRRVRSIGRDDYFTEVLA